MRVKKEFNLETGSIVLTDLTDWSGYGIIPPDTASVLLKLVAPTGAVVYQNIGYDTDNFGAPDFDLTTSVLNKTIPQDVNGNYITGTYTLYTKAQVVQGIDNVTTSSVIQQASSALPNNVLTKSAATSPPFSQIKFFVLGNVDTALMNEGDTYDLNVNGDIVSYTVPSATTATITNIVVANTGASSYTFTLYLDDVLMANTVAIAANSIAIFDVKQVLAATKTIKGGASATSINFHISGVEIS